MAELIQYWDDTLKKYVEVSTTSPLPTNAVGGGAGGAEEVEITSTNGAATTGQGNADGRAVTDIGLVTNSREYGFNGTTWDRIHATTGSLHVIPSDGANTALVQDSNADGRATTDKGLATVARIYGFNGANYDRIHSANGDQDGLVPNTAGFHTLGKDYAWNGTAWDRVRSNMEGTLLASAVRTATTSSPNQTNHNSKGVIIYLNVTANPGGAETLKLSLRYIDISSGAESLDISSITTVAATNGLYTLQIYPGTLDTTDNQANNATYSMMLPRTWKATVTPSAAGSFTYSLGYSLIL